MNKIQFKIYARKEIIKKFKISCILSDKRYSEVVEDLMLKWINDGENFEIVKKKDRKPLVSSVEMHNFEKD